MCVYIYIYVYRKRERERERVRHYLSQLLKTDRIITVIIMIISSSVRIRISCMLTTILTIIHRSRIILFITISYDLSPSVTFYGRHVREQGSTRKFLSPSRMKLDSGMDTYLKSHQNTSNNLCIA